MTGPSRNTATERFDPTNQLRTFVYAGDGRSVVLFVEGTVDVRTAPHLGAALSEVTSGSKGTLVVDLSGLVLGGAECVSRLIDARHALRRHGRDLQVVNPPKFFGRVLAACHLEDLANYPP